MRKPNWQGDSTRYGDRTCTPHVFDHGKRYYASAVSNINFENVQNWYKKFKKKTRYLMKFCDPTWFPICMHSRLPNLLVESAPNYLTFILLYLYLYMFTVEEPMHSNGRKTTPFLCRPIGPSSQRDVTRIHGKQPRGAIETHAWAVRPEEFHWLTTLWGIAKELYHKAPVEAQCVVAWRECVAERV